MRFYIHMHANIYLWLLIYIYVYKYVHTYYMYTGKYKYLSIHQEAKTIHIGTYQHLSTHKKTKKKYKYIETCTDICIDNKTHRYVHWHTHIRLIPSATDFFKVIFTDQNQSRRARLPNLIRKKFRVWASRSINYCGKFYSRLYIHNLYPYT